MLTTAQTLDGSRTLDSRNYGETYHSINGALTEARHVFLDATGVSARLKRGVETHVLEIGFGLGLNALLTADLAASHNTMLRYDSYEHDLVSAASIAAMDYQSLLGKPELLDTLLAFIREQLPANSGVPCALSDNISLAIHLKDASRASFFNDTRTVFHAIYLDAFSPEVNPECWSTEFFTQLAQSLAQGGILGTYSAKGDVRRAMLAAGLQVSKHAGPPGKREMLLAFRG